jgi:hypothetical protein
MLGHRAQRILLLQGAEGMGKSCLVQRLRHECRQRQLRTALLDFRSSAPLDQPDQVIRQLRTEIGGVFARQLEQVETQIRQDFASVAAAPLLMNWLGGGGPAPAGGHRINLSGQVEVGGDVVGGDKITIANPTIVLNPNGGFDLGQAEAQTRRSTAFRAALAAALATEPLVLFIDHFEKASTEAKLWLRQHILGLHLEGTGNGTDGFDKLWIVAAGRSVPLQEETASWRDRLQLQPLAPFPNDIIAAFWVEKRGRRAEDIPVIARVSAGIPGLLDIMADNDEDAASRSKTA